MDMLEKLVKLGVSEADAEKFMTEEVETRNKEINDSNMVRRDKEEESENEDSQEEETQEEEKEILEDEEIEVDVDELMEVITPQINELIEAGVEAMRSKLEESHAKEVEALKSRIKALESDDSAKIQKAVDDLPEQRKAKRVIRPSRNIARNIETNEEVTIDSKAQLQAMRDKRLNKQSNFA